MSRNSLWLVMVCCVLGLVCGCGTDPGRERGQGSDPGVVDGGADGGDSVNDGDDGEGSVNGPQTFQPGVLYISNNPDSSLLFRLLTEDSLLIDAYGEKDSSGILTKVTAIQVAPALENKGSNGIILYFDEDGEVSDIVDYDGDAALSIAWLDSNTATVSYEDADGIQLEDELIHVDDNASSKAAIGKFSNSTSTVMKAESAFDQIVKIPVTIELRNCGDVVDITSITRTKLWLETLSRVSLEQRFFWEDPYLTREWDPVFEIVVPFGGLEDDPFTRLQNGQIKAEIPVHLTNAITECQEMIERAKELTCFPLGKVSGLSCSVYLDGVDRIIQIPMCTVLGKSVDSLCEAVHDALANRDACSGTNIAFIGQFRFNAEVDIHTPKSGAIATLSAEPSTVYVKLPRPGEPAQFFGPPTTVTLVGNEGCEDDEEPLPACSPGYVHLIICIPIGPNELDPRPPCGPVCSPVGTDPCWNNNCHNEDGFLIGPCRISGCSFTPSGE